MSTLADPTRLAPSNPIHIHLAPLTAAAPAHPPAPVADVRPKGADRLDQTRHLEATPGFTLKQMDLTAAVPIALLHLACIAAAFYFSWTGLIIAAGLWWLTGGIGVCLCYHRLLTHRSFKTPKWFEYILTVLGTMCWQGGPIKWVGEHRIHHKHSDHEHDPHSPKHGFNWSHVLWAVTKTAPGYQPRDAAKDLQRDPVMNTIDKYHYVWQMLLAGILFGVGMAVGGWQLGLSWLLWGVAVRTVFTYHATWFVNSASHTWGYRNHDTDDDSRNNWWVSLLAFGEGWHNNHHASQRSAAHGQRWFEVDFTYWTIRLLALVGLARDIVPVKHEH